MLVKTNAIVLKQVKYGDSSLIVKMYTRDYGLLSFMVKGIRSKRAKGKAAMMQPLMLLDLVLYLRGNQNLKSLREYQYSHVYSKLPYDIIRSTIGMFMLEVVLKCIKEEEANEVLFDFIYHAFITLDQSETLSSSFHLAFLAQLMDHIGFRPGGRFSDQTPYFDLQEGNFVEESPVTGKFLEPAEAGNFAILSLSPLDELEELEIKTEGRKLLLEQLLLYYELHIDGFRQLRSPEILRSVLH